MITCPLKYKTNIPLDHKMKIIIPVIVFWVCVLCINITFTFLFRDNQQDQNDSNVRQRFKQDVKSFTLNFQSGLDDVLKAHKSLIVPFNITTFPTPMQMNEIEVYNREVLGNDQSLYYAQYVSTYPERVTLIDQLRTLYNDSTIDVTIFNGTLQRTTVNQSDYFLVTRWSPPFSNFIYGFDLQKGTVPDYMFERIKQGKIGVNFRTDLSTSDFRYGAVVYLPVNHSGRIDILGSIIDIETIFLPLIESFDNLCFTLANYTRACTTTPLLEEDVIVFLDEEPVSVHICATKEYDIIISDNLFTTSIVMIVVQCIIFSGFIYYLYKSIVTENSLLTTHAKQDARNQFIAYIFHEVRVPLQAILASFEILMDDIPKDYKQIVSSGLSSCLHMNDLLNNVLELSRLEKKMDHFNDRWTSLPEVFESTSAQYDVYCKHASKRFVVDIDKNLHNVLLLFDSSKIKQVTSNLINNAVKYTPQNGTIYCRLKLLEQGFRIEVEDTGVGISDEGRKKLFLPYSQVQGVAQAGGTGLGLSIVRYIVEHYDGTYSCEQTSTHPGTIFTLDFPVKTRKLSHQEIDLQSIHLDDMKINVIPESLSVLIVEDDAPNRMILSRFFSKKGCKADVACNGKEAVELTQQNQYSCIIMDKIMPIMNGDVAAGKIRAHGVKTPIIALTGNALDHEVESFKKNGANIVLTKPVELKNLYECVLRYAQ